MSWISQNLLRKVTIDQLTRLCMVVRCKDYKPAAEKCHLTVQGLRKSIRELEKSLDVRLIDSRGSVMQVTPTAQRIAELWEARRIDIGNALGYALALGEGVEQFLSIGCQSGHWNALVQPIVAKAIEHFDGTLRISAHIEKRDQLERALRHGEIQIALFLDTAPHLKGFERERLGAQQLALYASGTRPANVDELIARWIDIDWGPSTSDKIRHYLFRLNGGNALHNRLLIDAGNHALDYCVQYSGVGYFPVDAIAEHPQGHQLYRLSEYEAQMRDVYLMRLTMPPKESEQAMEYVLSQLRLHV